MSAQASLLPNELLENIFSLSSPRDFYMSIPRVCRAWRKVATSNRDHSSTGPFPLSVRVTFARPETSLKRPRVKMFGRFARVESAGTVVGEARSESTRAETTWPRVVAGHVTIAVDLKSRMDLLEPLDGCGPMPLFEHIRSLVARAIRVPEVNLHFRVTILDCSDRILHQLRPLNFAQTRCFAEFVRYAQPVKIEAGYLYARTFSGPSPLLFPSARAIVTSSTSAENLRFSTVHPLRLCPDTKELHVIGNDSFLQLTSVLGRDDAAALATEKIETLRWDPDDITLARRSPHPIPIVRFLPHLFLNLTDFGTPHINQLLEFYKGERPISISSWSFIRAPVCNCPVFGTTTADFPPSAFFDFRAPRNMNYQRISSPSVGLWRPYFQVLKR